MKPIVLTLALAAVTAALPAARAQAAPDAAAQAAAPNAAAQEAEVLTESIALKHVSPGWMAFMLNPPAAPARQPAGERPAGSMLFYSRKDGQETIIRKGTPEGDRFEAQAQERSSGLRTIFSPPEGVRSIEPNEDARSLLVRGTAVGIAKLRNVVEFLDQPIRRVEVSVLSVRLSEADARRFGLGIGAQRPLDLNKGKKAPEGTFFLGFPRGQDFRGEMQKMIGDNRAEALLDARATVPNNTPGLFSSDFAALGPASGKPPKMHSPLPSATVQFVPTINNDDTITVFFEASARMPAAPDGEAEAAPAPGSALTTVANVRDGDTIALGGLSVKGQSSTVTFLTARIVRDAGEKK